MTKPQPGAEPTVEEKVERDADGIPIGWAWCEPHASLDYTLPQCDGEPCLVCEEIRAAVEAERERCRRRVLEQRCERGTPWDRALLTAVSAIDNDEPVVAIRAGGTDAKG